MRGRGLVAVLLLGACGPGAVVADSIDDFADAQGAKGWSYGWVEPPATEFRPAATYRDGRWWADFDNSWAHLGPDGASPNGPGGGRQPVVQLAVRRWTSTVAGGISFAGALSKIDARRESDGVIGSLVVDGATLYTQHVEGDDPVGYAYRAAASVHVGSTVDLVLDPGKDNAWDWSRFTATVRH